MSEIKLFSIKNDVKQLIPSEVLLEKELQNLIEDNMEKFFGVRFLKSEYVITNGRMDSIGIDENNCPVIVEYKRSNNENIIKDTSLIIPFMNKPIKIDQYFLKEHYLETFLIMTQDYIKNSTVGLITD